MIDDDLAMAAGSHQRLRAWLTSLPVNDPGEASELPDWTRGHVLTHMARNADSFVRLLDAASAGEVGDQYAGAPTRRNDEIEAGAVRPWDELVEDAITASTALDAAFAAADPTIWADARGNFAGGTFPLAQLPFRRTREVELHRVDVGLGSPLEAWPEEWVEQEWALAVDGLARRLPPDATVELRPSDAPPVEVGQGPTQVLTASRRELLAWLCGRRPIAGAPILGPWRP